MKSSIAVLATIVTLARAAGSIAADARPAPNLVVQTEDGTTVRLTDFRGNVVLVDFWASWCAPCKASFPALDALYREFRDRGLAVLALNLDERRRDADAFLSVHPHVMPVLFDPRGQAPQAFAIRGMPSSVLIDRVGNIRFTHTGYTEKVVESYRHEIGVLLEELQP